MEKLRARAHKVSQALQHAGIPHAVIGGLAVAAHVSRANPGAERNTKDLDMLLNRSDLDRAAEALKPLGFSFRKVKGIPAFLPPREAVVGRSRFAEGVHLVWAGERVRPEDLADAPTLEERPVAASQHGYACLDVSRLLKMKLTSFRLKDKVHVQDMLQVGLITPPVRKALPPELRVRLDEIEEITRRERMG
jgi:hypothetical protein